MTIKIDRRLNIFLHRHKYMDTTLDPSWLEQIGSELTQEYFLELKKFVENERARFQVFPPEADVFAALNLTPFPDVKAVLLGQDPYHDDGQAHGLCFSVCSGTKHPPSLKNIFRELQDDLDLSAPQSGDLSNWAKQGVLLLNTVLTVRAHEANSHKKQGWERFTDAIIRSIGARPQHTVFLLWGKPAQEKQDLIDASRHTILRAAHPSPLSARRGFFGSKPFSQTNEALHLHNQSPIEWQL